jgi:hypothetical protein
LRLDGRFPQLEIGLWIACGLNRHPGKAIGSRAATARLKEFYMNKKTQ